MDYRKAYDSLIMKCKSRGLRKGLLNYYTERHHIVPKCLGGGNYHSNLVLLTAREHFIAHRLLSKIHYDNIKLLYAVSSFCLMIDKRSLSSRQLWYAYRAKSKLKQYENTRRC